MRTIAECKKERVLPKKGTPVITKPSRSSEECTGFLVKIGYLEARRSGPGIYRDFVAGCGGDVWWIEHPDGEIGAYLTDEVFDPPGTEKKRFRTHRKGQS